MFRHSSPERPRPPRALPAQMSVRVAVLGGMALIMFAVIGFRLWYLQVLSSGQYTAQAENNQVRDITVQAPRGEILARNGKTVLVDNRTSLALQIRTLELPNGKRARVKELRALAKVLKMPYHKLRNEIKTGTQDLPSSPVTIRRDVSDDLVYYLRENQDRFPGVSIDRVFVRNYPYGSEAAQVLGYTGQVDAAELKEPQYQGVVAGDTVGKGGVESTYDSALRGINGTTRVQVDASGQPTGGILSQRPPRAGNNLQLTIDPKVQAAGEAALRLHGLPGAFVAMNIDNGQILGLGSAPTYDPSALAKPRISQATYNAIFGKPGDALASTEAPFFDRAIAGGYPVGSTMKPITTIAGLDSGILQPDTVINDTGSFDIGGGVPPLQNAGGSAAGPVSLSRALTISDDYYFYDVGYRIDRLTDGDTKVGPLEQTAMSLGLGSDTGIDLPGELPGNVPTPPQRNKQYKVNTSPNSPGGRSIKYPPEITDRPWSVGDSVNLAVGQGDLQADPLQMAVAYAAIGNGGNIVRPHVGMKIIDSKDGQVIQTIDPSDQRHVGIKESDRILILNALHNAAQTPEGTSYPVFGNYPIGVAGKTGTAQRNGQQDQSWYVVLAPYPNPKVVVAVTIEQGGFGVDTAAPAAQSILNAYFDERIPNFAKKVARSPAPSTTSTSAANGYGL
jgi:penicillin-binding protein 2